MLKWVATIRSQMKLNDMNLAEIQFPCFRITITSLKRKYYFKSFQMLYLISVEITSWKWRAWDQSNVPHMEDACPPFILLHTLEFHPFWNVSLTLEINGVEGSSQLFPISPILMTRKYKINYWKKPFQSESQMQFPLKQRPRPLQSPQMDPM